MSRVSTPSAQSRFLRLVVAALLILATSGSRASAQTASADQSSATQSSATQQQPAANERESPWLIAPAFSSSPKLGTSIGGLGAYLRTFDPASRVSIFGVIYIYTSTHSQIASAFARTSFGADHHRIVAFVPFGHIKNDYDDYLGTGQALKTEANTTALFARYLYRAVG